MGEGNLEIFIFVETKIKIYDNFCVINFRKR